MVLHEKCMFPEKRDPFSPPRMPLHDIKWELLQVLQPLDKSHGKQASTSCLRYICVVHQVTNATLQGTDFNRSQGNPFCFL